MSDDLKSIFEKLKNQNVIKGDYANLEFYLDKKKQRNNIKYLVNEMDEIKKKYFEGQYYTFNRWISNYLLAKEYYKEHGNLETKKEEVYEKFDLSLKINDWLDRQRYLFKKGQLLDNQIKLLNDIEMIWDLKGKIYKDDLEKSKEENENQYK